MARDCLSSAPGSRENSDAVRQESYGVSDNKKEEDDAEFAFWTICAILLFSESGAMAADAVGRSF